MNELNFQQEIKSVNDTLVRAAKNIACHQQRGETLGASVTLLPTHLREFCSSDPTVKFLFENLCGTDSFFVGFFDTFTLERFVDENNEKPGLAANGVLTIGVDNGRLIVFNTKDRRIYYLDISTTYETAFVTKDGNIFDSWDTFDELFEEVKHRVSSRQRPGDPNYLHILLGIV